LLETTDIDPVIETIEDGINGMESREAIVLPENNFGYNYR